MRYITKREKVKLAEDLGIAVPNSFRKEAMAESAPAAPQSDPLTKEAEASVRLDGDTHCVEDVLQSDQPAQGEPTATQKMRDRPVTHAEALYAASRLITSFFGNSGDKARASIPVRADDDDVLILDYISEQAAPASQPSAPAQKPHLDGITPEFQPSPASVDAREWAERIMVRWLEGNITLESLATLLESFRAATRAQWDSELAGAYQMHDEIGVRAEALEQAAQFVEKNTPYLQGVGSVGVPMAEHIRKMGSDPNWLARQLDEVRANTLAHMLELLNGHRLLSGKPGDECSCGKWNANYTNRDRDVWQAWLQHIRALSPDHNWLARQIAEAQIAELDALETVTDEAGVLAEWGSVAQIRYKNRRRAALESASAKLGDKGEAR